MLKDDYRGYVVEYQLLGDRWSGTIALPGSPFQLAEYPEATKAEGEGVFLARAHTIIDADISKLLASRQAP